MTERDLLREGLQALESDLFYVHLAGPEAARRRAGQRSQRRAASVAGALAIVAAAGFLGPIGSIFGTDGEPSPARPATRIELAPSTATPTPTPLPALTADVLLDATELVPTDGGWQEIGTPWAGEGPLLCAQGGSDDADEVLLGSFVPADEGRVDQVVERYSTPTDAEARFEEIRAAVADCASGLDVESGGPPEFWLLAGVGDTAWVAGYWTSETVGELRRRVEIGVVWTGAAVTHVAWGFLAQDSIEPVVTDVTVAAAEKLCGPAGGACVSVPALKPDTQALERAP